MKKIILTGGGSGGHVTPNIALMPTLAREGYEIFYIGSKNGIEKELTAKTGVEFHGISSGKLRRYMDVKNFTDMFRVVKGVGEAYAVIKKIKPDVIFSKGGFVIVPVVLAAKALGVPVVIHESDMSPGLANSISMPMAKAVCVSFPETLDILKSKKATLTGSPIRRELFTGDRTRGLELCGFGGKKPVLLIMGGSLGSAKINRLLRAALGKLMKSYNIIHICGKGNVDENLKIEGYAQFEYISDELPHIFAACDIVVSRAGANSISEFLALRKPALLIPLPKTKTSRGDQMLNAESFRQQGFCKVIDETALNEEMFIAELVDLYTNRAQYIAKMNESQLSDSIEAIVDVIKSVTK